MPEPTPDPRVHAPVDGPVGEAGASASAGTSEVADRSLAAERTDIAWARSGLAMITCLAAVLKRLPTMDIGTRWGLLGFVTAAGVLLVGLGGGRVRHATSARASIDATERRLRSIARTTTLVGLLCLAVVASAAF